MLLVPRPGPSSVDKAVRYLKIVPRGGRRIRMGKQQEVTGPWTGAVPTSMGLASVVRIPLPGSRGLAIEFRPRNFKGKSTSTVFIQDKAGRRMLRLDYGYNVKSKTVDYHWNQKGTFDTFNIADHTTVGRGGVALYRSAQAFRYAGRVLLVVGVAVDTVSIVQADRPLRRATQVVSAWAAAWAGAEGAGAIGAAIGTIVEPGGGTVVVGVVFAIGGGIAGYWAGEKAGAEIYDWGNAKFAPLPRAPLGAAR